MYSLVKPEFLVPAMDLYTEMHVTGGKKTLEFIPDNLDRLYVHYIKLPFYASHLEVFPNWNMTTYLIGLFPHK